MAYVSTVSYTETSITVDISGLSSRQNTYSGFRFRINGGSWFYVSVQSGYTGYDSGNHTFYGLTCGNSYYIEGEAQTNSWYPATAKWANTSSCPLPTPTPTPTGFSMSATSSTELSMSWNSVGADYYEVAIYSPISDSRIVYGTSTYWGGLSPNTTYYGYVRAYDSSKTGWSNWSSYDYATTPKPPDTTPPSLSFPTPSGSSVTSSSIYAYVSATDNVGLSYFQFYLNDSVKSTQYVSGTSASANYTFSGLSDNTSYSIKVVVSDVNGYTTSLTRHVTTESGRPTNFSWSVTKTSGQPFNVLASEWNSLQNKINEFRSWKKLSQYSYYTYYNGLNSFTRALYNAEVMAYHFNQIRNSIGEMGTTPSSVVSGQEITASQFNGLVNSLNSIY